MLERVTRCLDSLQVSPFEVSFGETDDRRYFDAKEAFSMKEEEKGKGKERCDRPREPARI